MKLTDQKILTDLTRRAYQAGQKNETKPENTFYYETFFLPGYFMSNFPNHPLEELASACIRLNALGYVEYAPRGYIILKPEGADYCSKHLLEF